MFPGDPVQTLHVQRQPGQVNRNDGPGARGNGRFEPVQINIAGDWVDVGKHRGGAYFEDDIGGGYPGYGRGDHFVTGTDPGDAQGDLHGAGARVERAHRAPAKKLRQLGFEGLNPGTAGNPARAQYITDGADGGFIDDRFGKRQKRQLAHEDLWIRVTNGSETRGP
ncbi:hypothetical protein D3C78_1113690 [compost metagenome]